MSVSIISVSQDQMVQAGAGLCLQMNNKSELTSSVGVSRW